MRLVPVQRVEAEASQELSEHKVLQTDNPGAFKRALSKGFSAAILSRTAEQIQPLETILATYFEDIASSAFSIITIKPKNICEVTKEVYGWRDFQEHINDLALVFSRAGNTKSIFTIAHKDRNLEERTEDTVILRCPIGGTVIHCQDDKGKTLTVANGNLIIYKPGFRASIETKSETKKTAEGLLFSFFPKLPAP